MGIFDSNQSNKKYNNAIPNYDVDDNVDIVPCTEDCPYKDDEKQRCVFETCILNQFPLSIPFHTSVTKICDVCGEKYVITFGETDHPFKRMALCLCDNCMSKAIKLIRGDDND